MRVCIHAIVQKSPDRSPQQALSEFSSVTPNEASLLSCGASSDMVEEFAKAQASSSACGGSRENRMKTHRVASLELVSMNSPYHNMGKAFGSLLRCLQKPPLALLLRPDRKREECDAAEDHAAGNKGKERTKRPRSW